MQGCLAQMPDFWIRKHQKIRMESWSSASYVSNRSMMQLWQKERRTQLVFSDIGSPNDGSRFSVYSYIKEGLIKNGIPKEQTAFNP